MAAVEIAAKMHGARVFVVFDSLDVKTLTRDESVHKAINAQVGLTKVYSFLSNALKKDKAKVVYDSTSSGLLHVVSDL